MNKARQNHFHIIMNLLSTEQLHDIHPFALVWTTDFKEVFGCDASVGSNLFVWNNHPSSNLWCTTHQWPRDNDTIISIVANVTLLNRSGWLTAVLHFWVAAGHWVILSCPTYTHLKDYLEHLFNFSLMQLSYQPITWQLLRCI